MKNSNSKWISLISTAGAVLMLSACGSQSTNSLYTGQNAGGTTSGSTTSGYGYQTGDSSTDQNLYNLPAAPEQRIELSGQNGTNPSKTLPVSTSHTLKIKITPLAAPNITEPGYTNWSFPYGCLQVTVVANGMTQTTQVLKVSGTNSSTCSSAPSSQVLDFSNQVSGSGNVNVTVQNPNYDNCRYYWPLYYGCSMSPIFETHRVAFDMQIQTDNTWMAQ